MEVHLRERLYDLKQDALLDHEFRFFAELQALQDPLDAGGIGGDELQKVGVEIVAITHQLFQRDTFCVEKRHLALSLDHFFLLRSCHTADFGGCLQDLVDRGIISGQDAVKAANDRHGDDDAAVFLRRVGAAEFVCNALDEIDFAVYVCSQCSVVHFVPSLS